MRLSNIPSPSRLLPLTLTVGITALCSQLAFAHGYIETPKSRAYLCNAAGGLQNTGCGPVAYEPQSLEYIGRANATDVLHYPSQAEACTGDFSLCGPADGAIPSGGVTRFSQLNEQTANRWHKVDITPGPHEFVWKYEASHATRYWQFFITKKDWNPNEPLTRAAFEMQPLLTQNWNGSVPISSGGTTRHVVNIPDDHSGYHVILATWKVDDTDATFYQVVDLNIQNAQIPVSAWNNIGAVQPEAMAVGDKVMTRVFTEHGEQPHKQITLNIENSEQAQADVWPFMLAQKVNNANLGYQMGQLNRKDQVVPGYGKNNIFVSKNSDIYSVLIKKEQAQPVGELKISGLQNNYVLSNDKVDLHFTAMAKGADYTLTATVYNDAHESIAHQQGNAGDNTPHFMLALEGIKPGQYDLAVVAKSEKNGLLQQTHHFTVQEEPSVEGGYDYVFPASLKSYNAGTKVLQPKDGHTYECKPFPYSGYCIQWSTHSTQFEPGTGSNWQDAWIRQ
ncbi:MULTISPECIES: N-acetylglucosamine-binding protein GbpA [Pseudomonas]|uniref:N-acetylglucosamine-binding protein GbpA n=1 Tax=Pseudomonas TaxID=286 RepID=UPI00099D354D|nr:MULTISPECIES: N-acetylglucosamine-binding protein GbpA [Pseudomonas]MCK3838871.1 N-acetylglucosamine-binding protein GbpA [Pseudomonas sp. NCIMB 10586]OPB05922.1 N-acetylglucosamine-binding protein GbpA [Pseudomonas synxantha]VCU67858.1 GlcNAc-binding protein A [Pseudomonas synxantha]